METGHGERGLLWGLLLIAAGVLLLLGNLDIVYLPWEAIVGPLALGIPGLIFATVYTSNRDQWWAIIPGGVLLTLAVIAFVGWLMPWAETGWIFFLGLAVTFGLVWRETGRTQRWAHAVSLVCLALAGLTMLGSLLRFVLPLALLGAGLYLLGRDRLR